MSPLENYSLNKVLVANPRSRTFWNERLSYWELPASNSEEQQIQRAADMVRMALSSSNWLKNEGAIIKPQGSYHNNTNVRIESDMDLRLTHPCIKLVYANDVVIDVANTFLGIYAAGRSYSDIAKDMKHVLIFELTKQFGSNNIDSTGKKAIRIKKCHGSRADVDIVPCFNFKWVMWNATYGQYNVEDGIAILSDDGAWTCNFPDQHYTNGVIKRTQTSCRFKRNVRMLKKLKDELVFSNILQSKQVPSFLIESLTYAVDNVYFLNETDDRYGRLLRILYRMRELLSINSWVGNAKEINGIKYLFCPAQPWTVGDAQAFILESIKRLEA